MTAEIIIIFSSILFLLAALYLEWFKPTVVFFIAILFLVFTGILDSEEALSGFANEQLAVIILLLIISDIFKKSSVIHVVFNFFFGEKKSSFSFQFIMMSVVAGFSAFFNNTPLVAMMMPYVSKWSKQNGVSASKLLIPLSYAAILGGCVTLIGTSTNLIVDGMAVNAGFEPLSIFDFTIVGLPMLVIGIVYLLLFGNRLLPSSNVYENEEQGFSREYLVETQIKSSSKLIGKSVEDVGLRSLIGVYLVEIVRLNGGISPVNPEEILQDGDVLIFAGDPSSIEEFKNSSLGLTLPKVVERMLDDHASINEVAISFNSSLTGKLVKETDFRARFDAAIVAVHRNGERLSGKIGDITLKAGDILLVFSGRDFLTRTKSNQAFYILTHTEKPKNINVGKVSIVFTSLLLAIGLAALGIIPLLSGLGAVLLIAILMKIVPLNEIRKGLDFDLIVLIAFGLAFGKAMINSGASEYLAELFLILNPYIGSLGFLMLIFLVTNILAAYITNKASVAILFPISVSLAMELGLNPIPFILIVSFGAAANFITPIGYQTNLMVYGPGGYSFKDYFKIGWPLTLMYMIGSSIILYYYYNL